MSVELILSGLSILVTFLLGLLVWNNSRRGNQVAAHKVTVEEQARIDVRDDMVAHRRGEELQRLYTRVDNLEKAQGEREEEIRKLRASAKSSEKRERLMYTHMRELRNHIVNELPPPPPTMPRELSAWFEMHEHPPLLDE